jgi:Mg-chelatase subunit ChlD
LYEFSYPVGEWRNDSSESTRLKVDIHTTPPLKSVFSPTHKLKVERKNGHDAMAVLQGPGADPSKTFRLYFDASERTFGLKVLTHRTKRDGGFFMLMAAPKVELDPTEISQKDLVFVIDTSGSMLGKKMEQAKSALLFCLKCLRPGDRFNIVTFASTVRCFTQELSSVDKDTLDEAADFVRKIVASGGTNIDEALCTAYEGRERSESSAEPRIFQVVFLTDGRPTAGETRPEAILKQVQGWNRKGNRLFVFGVGDDVDPYLLDRLARDNQGVVEYVKPDENLEIKLSSFYEKIAYPVLTDITIDFGSIRVDDVHHKTLPDLFKGSQLILFGKYRSPGKTTIVLSGNLAGKQTAFLYPVHFVEKEKNYEFIPRLWARRRVAFLADEIRLRGPNKELKDEIVRLGKRWGIVTQYTSFLVVEDGEVSRVAKHPSGRRGSEVRAVLKDAEVSDHNETDGNKDHKDPIRDKPFQGRYWNSAIGIGGGADGCFGGRFGGKRNLMAYGGGRRTESAVLMGLVWLKNHQNPNRLWSTDKFMTNCKKGTCTGQGSTSDYDIGNTGLALLAFLGAGHTHKTGKFKRTVKNALKALHDYQLPNGCFGKQAGNSHWLYNHLIATMAMAEAYGLSHRTPLLHGCAQKAVDFLVEQQTPYSGWATENGSPCDTVLTGWAVLALKSAKLTGLTVPKEAFEGARNWFDRMTESSNYRVGFLKPEDGGVIQGKPGLNSLTSTGIATIGRIFMGSSSKNPKILGGGMLLKQSRPIWDVKTGTIDMEYWHFGTLAMFQLGSHFWKEWNPNLKNALVPTQIRKGCGNGSWDPVGTRAKTMGRVWATAINVLTLEIYYRYGRILGRK